jgi:hypothetical protein
MDAQSPKREGLLNDYLSEAELAAELDKDIRTVRRWRKLQIGPPYVMSGKTPYHPRELTQQWLAAGGTSGVGKARARRRTSDRGIKPTASTAP